MNQFHWDNKVTDHNCKTMCLFVWYDKDADFQIVWYHHFLCYILIEVHMIIFGALILIIIVLETSLCRTWLYTPQIFESALQITRFIIGVIWISAKKLLLCLVVELVNRVSASFFCKWVQISYLLWNLGMRSIQTSLRDQTGCSSNILCMRLGGEGSASPRPAAWM